MAISKRGSRKINIDNTIFRWSVTGNDGWITIVIWPEFKDDVKLIGIVDYHEEYAKLPNDSGIYKLTKGQIIITNRVIRKIIEHITVDKFINSSGQIDLGRLENILDIHDIQRVIPRTNDTIL